MKRVVRALFTALSLSAAATADAQSQQGAPTRRLPAISPQAQLALDDLAPRFATEIPQVQGWFRERPVLYFNFGDIPQPVPVAHVYWPVHGFDAMGNPVAIRAQRPIFSTLPGLPEYSGIWRLTYVITADHAQPNQLRDVAAIEDLVKRNRAVLHETTQTFNLPIVARGTRLVNDSTVPSAGWYAGRDVDYFDFGAVAPQAVGMWRFSRATDGSGDAAILADQNSVVDSIPGGAVYPDLWAISIVRVDSQYVPNTIKSAAAMHASGFLIDPPAMFRNLPITMVDGKPAERAPSPMRLFADLRTPDHPAPTKPQ